MVSPAGPDAVSTSDRSSAYSQSGNSVSVRRSVSSDGSSTCAIVELKSVGVTDIPDRVNSVTTSAYVRPSRLTVCE